MLVAMRYTEEQTKIKSMKFQQKCFQTRCTVGANPRYRAGSLCGDPVYHSIVMSSSNGPAALRSNPVLRCIGLPTNPFPSFLYPKSVTHFLVLLPISPPSLRPYSSSLPLLFLSTRTPPLYPSSLPLLFLSTPSPSLYPSSLPPLLLPTPPLSPYPTSTR